MQSVFADTYMFFLSFRCFFLFLFMLVDQGTEANTAFLGETHSRCHTVEFFYIVGDDCVLTCISVVMAHCLLV